MGLVSTVRIWSCDACGKTGRWSEGWMSKLILHRKPVPYDEEIVVCSRECGIEFERRKSRSKRAGGAK
jgi:hypothetical protein